MPPQARKSFQQVLKSTAITGGASAVSIAIGILRTKATAMILGPSGVGVFALLTSTTSFVNSIVGLGINTGSVRQIAESVSSGDQQKISATLSAVKRTSIMLGLLGTIIMFLTADPISSRVFGDVTYAAPIAFISVTVALAEITGAHKAILQGHRKLRELALATILEATAATIVGIALIYFLRNEGVPIAIVATSLIALGATFYFTRKLLSKNSASSVATRQEYVNLVATGSMFMVSGLLSSGSAFVTRSILVREHSIESVGLYQASYAISGIYIGFVLSAMSADYYPRLAASQQDDSVCNMIVNDQLEAAVLLSVPGILITLSLAEPIIQLLYTAAFVPAVPILAWQLIGTLGRVISWPVSYVLIARGHRSEFIVAEIFANAVYVVVVLKTAKPLGALAPAIAFAVMYAFYLIAMFFWLSYRTRLSVSSNSKTSALVGASATLLVFALCVFLEKGMTRQILMLAVTGATSFWCLRRILYRSGMIVDIKKMLVGKTEG